MYSLLFIIIIILCHW